MNIDTANVLVENYAPLWLEEEFNDDLQKEAKGVHDGNIKIYSPNGDGKFDSNLKKALKEFIEEFSVLEGNENFRIYLQIKDDNDGWKIHGSVKVKDKYRPDTLLFWLPYLNVNSRNELCDYEWRLIGFN